MQKAHVNKPNLLFEKTVGERNIPRMWIDGKTVVRRNCMQRLLLLISINKYDIQTNGLCALKASLITMTSHERHAVSNHRSFECLLNSLWGHTSTKHQSPHNWPFLGRIPWWPVNSGSVTQKRLPFHDFIMKGPCVVSPQHDERMMIDLSLFGTIERHTLLVHVLERK